MFRSTVTGVPRQPLLTRAINSLPFITIAAVADVIALATVLSSRAVRTWISGHGGLVFGIGLAIVTLLLVSIEVQRRRLDPDPRDIDLMKRLRAELGADADIVKWVRNDFAPNFFRLEKWDQLGDIYRDWCDDPGRRFADRPTQRAYDALIGALGEFRYRTEEDTWLREGPDGFLNAYGLPPEWQGQQHERWKTAIEEIGATRTTFLKAVDDLMTTAHERGL